MKIKGRAFLLLDEKGELIKDIDTDQIYHNAYLYVTEPKEMAKYALGNLKGYEDFSKKVKKGDILIAGHNFGAGSSRQHAVSCFMALGIGAIVAPSFGAIYKRNAINSAFPILECPGIDTMISEDGIKNLETIEIDFEEGALKLGSGKRIKCKKPSKVQLDILKAGGLIEYGKR